MEIGGMVVELGGRDSSRATSFTSRGGRHRLSGSLAPRPGLLRNGPKSPSPSRESQSCLFERHGGPRSTPNLKLEIVQSSLRWIGPRASNGLAFDDRS
jgi:hypothetical protein